MITVVLKQESINVDMNLVGGINPPVDNIIIVFGKGTYDKPIEILCSNEERAEEVFQLLCKNLG